MLYQAISEGKQSPLPELEIQYADYAYWQRRYLSGDVLEEHLQYWKKQLGGKLPVLNLATDHPRPLVSSNRGATKSALLPAELCKPLRALARQEGVTMFMLLLAAFKTLLYKYTSQEDIIVSTSALNRNRAEIEPLIGYFVNMLPMRTNLSDNPRFTEVLRQVRDVALGAYAHQEMPFDKLIEEIRPERGVGQTPLFNVVFGVQNAPRGEGRLTGLKLRPLAGGPESAKFDLSLWIIEVAEAIGAQWTYSADLFEEETIVRLHEHFATLLASIMARPDALLDELEMFSETERQQAAANRSTRQEYTYSRFKGVKPRALVLSED